MICTNSLSFPIRREAKWNWADLVRCWSSSSFISQLVNIIYSMPDVTALSSRPVATYYIRNSQGYLWSRGQLGKSVLQLTGTTTVRGAVDVNLDRQGLVFWHVILDAEAEKLKWVCVIYHPHMLSFSDCSSAHDLFWMNKLKPRCKAISKTEVHLWVKHMLLIKKRAVHRQRIFRQFHLIFFSTSGKLLLEFTFWPTIFNITLIDWGL